MEAPSSMASGGVQAAALEIISAESKIVEDVSLVAQSGCPGAVHRCRYMPHPTVSFGSRRPLRIAWNPLGVTDRPWLARGSL
jgi:hypothetical protein